MKYRNLKFFFLIMALILPSRLHAHGVTSKVDTGGIVVSAMYDTGEAMDYARVTISAPGANLKFQSGRTDRNGRFCFFPDVSGDWKVVVDDEMGHRLEVNVPVDEAMVLRANHENGNAGRGFLTRCEKAVMGVSIIFGMSGILFWWKGRKTKK
ncbi:MAG: nickel transport protein [Desulfobacteraceae bacterium Eth-SRB2]|nr:MAG: nickel transport protein [Desulfobacteraceae bacterium Eth-SRB2]